MKGFRYDLTTRQVDIPREYRGKKQFKIYSFKFRRKDEHIRKGKGNFCNAQILQDLSKNTFSNMLINR